MSTVHTTALTVLFLSAWAGAAAQTPPLPAPPQSEPILQDLVATQAFQQQVGEYVTLHRLLEAPLPPLWPTRDMSRIDGAMRALALRIRTARAHAQQGDIITADVARMFRRRIATCLTGEAWAAILAERDTDEQGRPAPPLPQLQVNMEWPAQVPFDFVPPQLLLALPPLPPELQYRIIGRALVLWDHHANLIVDILPGAFASTT
jgi:hypothetical protein